MFNKDFYFHWADANNEPLNNWKDIAQYLLSIPMAHQLIGFYTVADDTDGILKVMRSYQYFMRRPALPVVLLCGVGQIKISMAAISGTLLVPVNIDQLHQLN